jgi:hypothetical protein
MTIDVGRISQACSLTPYCRRHICMYPWPAGNLRLTFRRHSISDNILPCFSVLSLRFLSLFDAEEADEAEDWDDLEDEPDKALQMIRSGWNGVKYLDVDKRDYICCTILW